MYHTIRYCKPKTLKIHLNVCYMSNLKLKKKYNKTDVDKNRKTGLLFASATIFFLIQL